MMPALVEVEVETVWVETVLMGEVESVVVHQDQSGSEQDWNKNKKAGC